jgi:GxxExxY protein
LSLGEKVQKNRVGEHVLFPELSYKIIEIAISIHNSIGPGFTENIYETAFAYELNNNQIAFEQQKYIEVPYKSMILGTYRLDCVVDKKIIVELKAVNALTDLFKQQVVSYLRATGLRLRILINFGSRRLEHVRIIH